MKDRWVGKDVNLELLSEQVKSFLNQRYFRARCEVLKNGLAIHAFPENNEGPRIVARILGNSNDFVVEFSAGDRSFGSKLGLLTSFFGGGSFFLRSLKSQEMVDKLEKEFWGFLDKQLST